LKPSSLRRFEAGGLSPRDSRDRKSVLLEAAMATAPETLLQRLEKLGLTCDHISLDRLTPATTALVCFPMYMVANVHLWTDDVQERIPIVNLPGAEEIRETLEITRQQSRWELDEEHRRVLGTMLSAPKAADRVIYEYALETLRQYLTECSPDLSETIRTEVARMIVAVAHASGKGFLGRGEKVSPEERTCIRRINDVLGLDQIPSASWLMEQIGP
jgi:hypothetical protein